MRDLYNSIAKPTDEVLFKDQGSKFYGHAFPISRESQVTECLEILRKKYKKANHHCYAWKLGNTDENWRTNDDGEPNHSAGDPIYGQILAHDLSDILIVISRIFGGTKLGVGGLINAYRETAKLVIQDALIIQKTVTRSLLVCFEYPQMSAIMRVIKEDNLILENQVLSGSCKLTVGVPLSHVDRIKTSMELLFPTTVQVLD